MLAPSLQPGSLVLCPDFSRYLSTLESIGSSHLQKWIRHPQWSGELCHIEFLGSTFLHWSLSHSWIRLCYWPLALASFCRRSKHVAAEMTALRAEAARHSEGRRVGSPRAPLLAPSAEADEAGPTLRSP